MGIPWVFALKAIPWETVLRKAPELVRAATDLVSKAKMRKMGSAAGTNLQELADRISFLETYKQADAEVLKQATEQIERLTAAAERIAARFRLLLIWCAGLTMTIFGFAALILFR